ncbi:hypothetical protein I1100191F8_26540 [Phocaeicola dorei]
MEDCNQYKRLILSYHSTNAWRELARSTNSKIVTMEKKKMFDSFAWRILSHFDRKRLWKITEKPKL